MLDASPDAEVPALDDWVRRTDLFIALGAIRSRVRYRLLDEASDRMLDALEVTDGFLRVLSLPDEAREVWHSQGETSVVLLADRSGLRDSLHRQSRLPTWEGVTLRVVGVVDRDVALPIRRLGPKPKALVPFKAGAVVEREQGSERGLLMLARLAEGVRPDDVSHALSRPADGLRVTVTSLERHLRQDFRSVAAGAFLAVVFVVLVCAANLINLALTQAVYRKPEFLARRTLGATTTDLSRLIIVEHSTQALLGTGLGVLVVTLALPATAAMIPPGYLILGPPIVDGRVITVAIGTGVGLALVLAATTILSIGRYQRVLLGAGALIHQEPRLHLRSALLFSQVAVTMVLLSLGLLLARSYSSLRAQNPGFSPQTTVVSVLLSRGLDQAATRQTVLSALDRLKGVGIPIAGAAIGAMLDQMATRIVVRVPGRPIEMYPVTFVTNGYFATVGGALLLGRDFESRDSATGVIVNESFARRAWPGESWIGEIALVAGQQRMVVGVARDMFDRALDAKPVPAVFLPFGSESLFVGAPVSFVLKLPDEPTSVSTARRAIENESRDVLILDIATLEQRLLASVKDRTFVTLLCVLFGTATLLLCVASVATAVSFSITRRSREIAVRIALGSTRGAAAGLLLRHVLWGTLPGVAVGVIVGAWLSGSLASMLYDVRPGDPATLLLGVAVLIGVVCLATLVPLRRLAAMDPAQALRE